MAAGSRVSAEKRHHNITAIVKDHVFVNFLVSPDTLLRENLDFVNKNIQPGPGKQHSY